MCEFGLKFLSFVKKKKCIPSKLDMLIWGVKKLTWLFAKNFKILFLNGFEIAPGRMTLATN